MILIFSKQIIRIQYDKYGKIKLMWLELKKILYFFRNHREFVLQK